MADFAWKQGDSKEPLEATLKDGLGVAVNLTGATVTFSMRRRASGDVKVNKYSVAVVSAVAGTVRYTPLSSHLDTPGTYTGEFEVVFGDGTIETFPNDPSHPYLDLTVLDDIA